MTKEKAKAAEPEVPPRRRPGQSIAGTAGVWRTLADHIRDRLPDMPHLAAEHAELDRLLVRITDSLARQDTLKKEIRMLTRGREVDLELARESRRRLVAMVQGRFGATSEELVGFGLKPRKRNRIRKQIEGEPSPPEPEEPVPEEPAAIEIE